MGKLRYGTSISLDGFVAGINQSVENPLGERGELLHGWLRELAVWRRDAGLEGGVTNASTELYEQSGVSTGAIIMGRKMFGGNGPWGDEPWRGWWGEDPPFHLPVIVLTHQPRDPIVMAGGTSFTFVTTGLQAALDMAREAAQGKDVAIYGGASVAKQYLAAGLLDELSVSLVPVFLGAGERLFDEPLNSAVKIEQTRVVEAPGVTHLRYRVIK